MLSWLCAVSLYLGAPCPRPVLLTSPVACQRVETPAEQQKGYLKRAMREASFTGDVDDTHSYHLLSPILGLPDIVLP